MKLSRIERLMLSNQFLILESLYPNEAEGYAEHREAIEKGYESHYEKFMERICDSQDVTSESECQKVTKILSMFRSLFFSREGLSDSEKSEIDESKVKSVGFDANNKEFKQFRYAKYYCKDGQRFPELEIIDSCLPCLERYDRMLIIWEKIEQNGLLTKQQIIDIIDA